MFSLPMVETNCKESFYSSAGKEGVIRLWVGGGGGKEKYKKEKKKLFYSFTLQQSNKQPILDNQSTLTLQQPIKTLEPYIFHQLSD